ncbi:3-dehydroquinate dehydratase [Nymphon striatum]|nr:3-dehydroquinate dehydratase [Nymphon striatum]
MNPGAYTHTSIAIRDAIIGVEAKVYEVHISNVYEREEFRHHSYISDIAQDVFVGMGIPGYIAAIDKIASDKGVCGACARTQEVQIVADVNAVTDHIACSASTQSEIVLPVLENGQLIAVLDIDSNKADDFDQHDAEALAAIIKQNF